MGKWNRRWIPRRRYNQDSSSSPPLPYHQRTPPHPTSTTALPNSVPLWEQQFCSKVGSVPWHKVVIAKNYTYYFDNVIKWNDSAGEEAFQNAKQRFWAHINNLHCDIPLPDPDMYIDEIDWNPDIDPELMLESQREFFNPDDENDAKVKNTEQNTHNSVSGGVIEWDVKRPGGHDNNPWEENIVLNTSKDITPVYKGWNNSLNSAKIENPWEQSYAQGKETHNDNQWGGCGLSRDLKPNNCDNPWEQGAQSSSAHVKQKGWGDVETNSWGNSWGKSVKDSRSPNWESKFIPGGGASKERKWRDSGDCSWGWKQQEERQNYVSSQYLHPRNNPNGGWGSSRGGCRKREGPSHQLPSSYKSSRFQGDDSGAGHIWRKERTQ